MQRDKILIVDDSEMNRSILADMLSDGYDIVEAENGMEAVAFLAEHSMELSLVLLDIVMPKMDGFGVLEEMNKNGWINDLPVIIISAESGSSQVERGYELGATDFIARPFDALIVQRRVVNTLLLYAKQKRLIGMVEDQVYEKERHSDLMIDILSHIVEFRNGESGLHILHVRMLTDLILGILIKKTDRYKLTSEDISIISTASALHDIGKIAIAEEILNKPGKLTAEEFEIMKTHSAVGADMLSKLTAHQDEPLIKRAYEICRWHHERYDGKGYPDGISGEDIPIAAQVVALADVYDALTSERVYKPPFTHEAAVEMIVGGQCGVFNPLLLECLKENAERFRRVMEGKTAAELKHRKLQSISEGMLRSESGMSSRTLRLLDRERVRNNFFNAMTEAIQFEYKVSPPMISLSAWGAKKLGLDEIIMDPSNNQKLFDVLGEDVWKELSGKLRASTPENPDVRIDCPLYYDGSLRWHRVIARALWSDDEVPVFEGAIGTTLDIHDSRLKMEELAQRAAKDPLTGLLNRESAKQQIELMTEDRPDGLYALAIFDLDFFKNANDNYGHMFGDRVLKHVSGCLKNSVRGTDVSCRAGGDEFMLFLEYKTDIEKTIDRIFKTLCCRFENFRISVSMGVALSKDTGLDYEDLFHAADTALYAAKRRGRGNYCFYDDSLKNLLGSCTCEEDEEDDKEGLNKEEEK